MLCPLEPQAVTTEDGEIGRRPLFLVTTRWLFPILVAGAHVPLLWFFFLSGTANTTSGLPCHVVC